MAAAYVLSDLFPLHSYYMSEMSAGISLDNLSKKKQYISVDRGENDEVTNRGGNDEVLF